MNYNSVSFNGFDPIRASGSGGSDGQFFYPIFGSLVTNNPVNGTVEPGMAEALTSADGVTWVLKLRPNVRFTDSTSYDAAAVKFNWERLKDPANAATNAFTAKQIVSMDVVDQLTLRFALGTVNAQFPRAIAAGIGFIGSPTAIMQKGSDKFGTDPVGAGAFTLKQWLRDASVTVVRNPNYWDSPRPYVDQVTVRAISDEQQRVNSYKAGEANILYTQLASSADQVVKAGGSSLSTLILNGGSVIMFNLTKAPFTDQRVRRAVVMAFDRANYAKVYGQGLFGPSDSLFQKSSPFYDPAIQQLPYDPVQAQATFDQVAKETGSPVTFTILGFSALADQVQFIQAQLQQYKNLKVDLELGSASANIARVVGNNYQAAQWGNPFDDPEPTWTAFFSGSGSFSHFSDPQVDADFNTGRQSFDPKQRVAAYKDAQRIIYNAAPALYYQQRYIYEFAKNNVQDLSVYQDGIVFWDRLWIKN